MKFEVGGFRERKRKGSSFQIGHKAEEKARSLGFYVVNRTTILTLVNDRFRRTSSNSSSTTTQACKARFVLKTKRLLDVNQRSLS